MNNFSTQGPRKHLANSCKLVVEDTKGMTLVEIMLVAGILGVLALVVANMTTTTNKSLKTASQRFEGQSLLASIRSLLSAGPVCSKNFQGKHITNNLVAFGDLKNASGRVMFSVGQKYGRPSVNLSSIKFGKFDPYVGSHSPGTSRLGTSVLEIKISRKALGSPTRTVTRNIPITVRVDSANKVVECSAQGTSSTFWQQSADGIHYASGKVGVGTSSPRESLDVRGNMLVDGDVSADGDMKVTGGLTTKDLEITGSITTNNLKIAGSIATDGNISAKRDITTDSSISARGDITGQNISARGTITAASDVRLKEDFAPIPQALDKILSIRGLSYRWKEEVSGDKTRQMGVLAQEVQRVFPEAINSDGEYLQVNYNALIAPLIESIRYLNETIRTLETQVQNQTKRNDKLQAIIDQQADVNKKLMTILQQQKNSKSSKSRLD